MLAWAAAGGGAGEASGGEACGGQLEHQGYCEMTLVVEALVLHWVVVQPALLQDSMVTGGV